MLYAFFWVISRRLHLPAYEDGTECSETSAYTIRTPGNYLEESTQQEKKYLQAALQIMPIYLYLSHTNDNNINSPILGQ